MAKAIYRVISWSLLALTLISVLLMLKSRSLPSVGTSAEAANWFDRKLAELAQAHAAGTPHDVRITEAELNSKLVEGFSGAAAEGSTSLKTATVRLSEDRLTATFLVNLRGIDVCLTLGGHVVVTNGSIGFDPTDVKLGSLPVPVALVQSTLRERLGSPEARERLKLPEFIKDVHIEGGELVIQGQ
jgi:hypothetical protein